jgi:hypothetical protein
VQGQQSRVRGVEPQGAGGERAQCRVFEPGFCT